MDIKISEIWLKSARPIRVEEGFFTIQLPNTYYRDWIKDNFENILEKEASILLGQAISLNYEFQKPRRQPQTHSVATEVRESSMAHDSVSSGLNKNQTFDSFVIGECNKFAHAAASAVADFPAQQYNPLFIYGSTGLGKTHLMHAVGNEILSRHPDARVMYVTAEDFMNEMINCLHVTSVWKSFVTNTENRLRYC